MSKKTVGTVTATGSKAEWRQVEISRKKNAGKDNETTLIEHGLEMNGQLVDMLVKKADDAANAMEAADPDREFFEDAILANTAVGNTLDQLYQDQCDKLGRGKRNWRMPSTRYKKSGSRKVIGEDVEVDFGALSE